MRAKKRATARLKPNEERHVNQRTVFSIAKKVAVDLLGHREMHACRASMPVVAPSRRAPVHLDAQRGGSTPPPTLTGVKPLLFT